MTHGRFLLPNASTPADDGAFGGWYVNFEAPRTRLGTRLDSVDWHLDLWLDPDGTPTWKDEDEARAAVGAGHLDPHELDLARATGETILATFDGWLSDIGDWREFVPPPEWSSPLSLPDSWAP